MTCILLLALACGKSASDHLDAAREDLDKSQYDPAIDDAGQGLQANPDDKTEWGLQNVLLESYARSGKATETKQKLEELATKHPDRMTPSMYSGSAQQLKDAGKGGAEQIEILDAGHKRFPDDPTISKMIREAAEAGDPAALERLKSLGYIQ
jgi:predicted Zn-dependent protease